VGEGEYFGWKAFWGSNPEWRSRGRREATVVRHFGEAAVPETEWTACHVLTLHPGIRLTTTEKSRKTSGYSDTDNNQIKLRHCKP
jgi:hypothetical protein